MARMLMTMLVCLTLFSCKKELSKEGRDKSRIPPFKAFMLGKQMMQSSFVSTDYIDYKHDGQMRKDLQIYVSKWIHDDVFTFSSERIVINQGAIEIPADSSVDGELSNTFYAVLRVREEDGELYMFFPDYRYGLIEYHVDSYDENQLVLSVPWIPDDYTIGLITTFKFI